MSGYAYITLEVSDETVRAHSCIDVLKLALDDLRKDAAYEGLPADMQTVILPPAAHAIGTPENRLGRWTVALSENPTDLVRRLSGAHD